jgi:hypothetical protein
VRGTRNTRIVLAGFGILWIGVSLFRLLDLHQSTWGWVGIALGVGAILRASVFWPRPR